MLAARASTRLARSAPAQRNVRVHAVRPVSTESLMAAVAAGSLLLAPPSLASLPDGYSSPQGSSTAAIEAKLDALIEARTGKAEALPELTEVPKAEAPKAKKETPQVVVSAPMAPAVVEPPAPTPAARVVEVKEEEPAVAPVAVPEPPKGLQTRPAAPAAAPAAEGPSSGAFIGGGVAVLAVVAIAALAGNNNSAEGQAPPAAAPAPASGEPAAAEASAETAAVGGAADTTNPSN